MNVSLTPELEKFVQSEVSSGMYQTASEVIRAGLRRLKDDKATVPAIQTPRTMEELEASLLKSVESFEHGEGLDGEEVFARLRKRAAARLKNA